MGEEVKIDDGVAEWEAGLPSPDDLTPLSQSLIPAELASAFSISPEPRRTEIDVNRASHSTLSSLRGGGGAAAAAAASTFKPFGGGGDGEDHAVEEAETEEGSEPKKSRMVDSADDLATDSCADDQSTAGGKALKRPRLVWTPQLHRRFVDVVAHLGLKNAVPKTIMQLMNVEGLTRENVASHLQKYRLYVKRMQGLSNEGPSPSDHLFASIPVPPQSFNESSIGDGNNGIANGSHSSVGNANSGNNNIGMPIPMPMPYHPPPQQIMPMQMMGMAAHGQHGFHGYDHNHHHSQQQQQYSSMVQQQRDWSGNKYNAYPHHVTQNHNKC